MCHYNNDDQNLALACFTGEVPNAIDDYNALQNHLLRLSLANPWNNDGLNQLARSAGTTRPTGGMSFELRFTGGMNAWAPQLIERQSQVAALIEQWRAGPFAANFPLLEQCVTLLSGITVGKRFGDVRASKILFFAVPDAPFYILDNDAWKAWLWIYLCCPAVAVGPPPADCTYASWRVFCEQIVIHQMPLADEYLAQFEFPQPALFPDWQALRPSWVMRRVVDFMLWRIGHAIKNGQAPPCPDG